MNKIHVLKHFHTQTKQTGSNRIQDEKFKKTQLFILMKGIINHEDIIVNNIYASNNIA
jgi:hypothetical protein